MTIIGYITGRNGRYEVYHNAPSNTSVYYRDSSGSSCGTGFTIKDYGFCGPDGSAYRDVASALAAIQERYDARRI